MNTLRERAVAAFWVGLASCACLFTALAARELGADWRLSTALGLGAGVAVLVIGGACCTASGRDGGGR